jgi:hypothetical protein
VRLQRQKSYWDEISKNSFRSRLVEVYDRRLRDGLEILLDRRVKYLKEPLKKTPQTSSFVMEQYDKVSRKQTDDDAMRLICIGDSVALL